MCSNTSSCSRPQWPERQAPATSGSGALHFERHARQTDLEGPVVVCIRIPVPGGAKTGTAGRPGDRKPPTSYPSHLDLQERDVSQGIHKAGHLRRMPLLEGWTASAMAPSRQGTAAAHNDRLCCLCIVLRILRPRVLLTLRSSVRGLVYHRLAVPGNFCYEVSTAYTEQPHRTQGLSARS